MAADLKLPKGWDWRKGLLSRWWWTLEIRIWTILRMGKVFMRKNLNSCGTYREIAMQHRKIDKGGDRSLLLNKILRICIYLSMFMAWLKESLMNSLLQMLVISTISTTTWVLSKKQAKRNFKGRKCLQQLLVKLFWSRKKTLILLRKAKTELLKARMMARKLKTTPLWGELAEPDPKLSKFSASQKQKQSLRMLRRLVFAGLISIRVFLNILWFTG